MELSKTGMMGVVCKWLVVALFGIALLACSQSTEKPIYPHEQCKRIELFDAITRWRITGAEDLAFDANSGVLYVSAYDRRAAERSARHGAGSIPVGGLYAVDVNRLFGLVGDDAAPDRLDLSPLLDASVIEGGLRPHGIVFNAERQELSVINRAYVKNGRRWEMQPRLLSVGADGQLGDIVTPLPCAANDLVSHNGDMMWTVTHSGCGWRAGIENVFSLKRSGLRRMSGDYFSRAGFANGVVVLPDGRLALAATREQALLILDEDDGRSFVSEKIKLPGGPDNLSIDDNGKIVAAVHPSLFKLMLNRKKSVGKSPSRVVRVSPVDGKTEILFDNPSGLTISAASVAIETMFGLVIGSATDEGLAICELKP